MLLLDQDQAGTDAIVQIAGAGPAGLAAAITLAQAGRRVAVHEAQREVGHRFQGDPQGLENWSTERDVLEILRGLGFRTRCGDLVCAIMATSRAAALGAGTIPVKSQGQQL